MIVFALPGSAGTRLLDDMKDLPLDSTDLSWLSGLARALLGEGHAAEDLVQDTLVAALEGAPPREVPARAWLAGVARRLAARRFRGEARRRERELESASREALPDSAELLERAEVAERLTAAARALPEPFRRTILLRFLEGLEPDEIARREGRPADTVRWRVRRGLELLRAELERRDGRDWSSWSVLLLPLARSGPHAGLATAGSTGLVSGVVVALGGMKLTSMLVAVFVGVGLLLWMKVEDGGAPPESSQPAVEVPGAASAMGEPELAQPADELAADARQVALPTESRPAAPERARTLQLTGRVVDQTGAGVAGARVHVTRRAQVDEQGFTEVAGEAFARTQADDEGRFRFEFSDEAQALPAFDLGANANGYLRAVLPNVSIGEDGQELVVVLGRGRWLEGRVVDGNGVGIPGLELLAHSPGAGLHHVSPSQILLRAQRALEGGESSGYFHSRARSGEFGDVRFDGLPAGDMELTSLDPGWTLTGPAEALAGERFVVWTALPNMGVRLDVRDARSGRQVERASATFRALIGYEDGSDEDVGQWVGRGRGGVSATLTAEMFPALAERRVTSVEFYGTVRVGQVVTDWRAEPLVDERGVRGVAEVRVDVDPSAVTTSLVGGARVEPVAALELVQAELDLDVRFEDGSPAMERIVVRWKSQPANGGLQSDAARLTAQAPGRYLLALPAGEVGLEIELFGASGSLPAWRGVAQAQPTSRRRVLVTLPRGATAVLERPPGWVGEWFVHASWRGGEAEAWRGSWVYSARGESLELNALRAAEWRFAISREGRQGDPEAIVRTARVQEGGRVLVN